MAIFVSGSFFIIPAKAQEEPQTLESYLEYFYNRYSKHLDEHGLIFKAPGYGVDDFIAADTARGILSLAAYYKYRALNGEDAARVKIKEAILAANNEMNSRNYNTQSFSDAWAQMAMVSLLDQVPFLLSADEQHQIYSQILDRMEAGIIAPDTSNRAALSAVYWQHTLNMLYHKNLVSHERKFELDKLIYKKIKTVLDKDVDQSGWYKEGTPMRFNPHYHLITAFAFLSYGEITGDVEFYMTAKKMTQNLRAITFDNGMIEARIGARPVGLGAQFYLGAALLSKKFGFKDFAAYLNYAYGDRFFSDPEYPNRLEYHSTLANSAPNFHDDISYSNLAELALLTPSVGDFSFSLTDAMNIFREKIDLPEIKIINQGNLIYFNYLKISQSADGNYTNIYNTQVSQNLSTQVKGVSSINITNSYGQTRLVAAEESEKIQLFYLELQKYFDGGLVPISNQTFNTLVGAYIYGGYTIPEIVDTIKNGPRAVHPTIPANVWQGSENYKRYLTSAL